MILVNGTRWYSGSLINNTSNNQTPYFLTADHCIGSLDANGDTDASFYSFWWNYESSTCSQNSSDFVAESTSGATLIANNSATDFALFELTESPLDSNIDVFFNGWDRTTNPIQGGVGIHHPSGDFKKIATHNITPSPGQVWGSGTHWRVNWTETTNGYSVTEGGSSGSPLFTSDKRIIGQLHGGSSINCSDPANDPGEYGRFHVSWDGSSPKRRLKDWLDPLNTNQNYLDGIGAEPLVTFQDDIDIICYDNPKVLNLNNIQNQLVTWQVSSNVTIFSSNNSSITVRAKYSNSTGNGWVKATLSNDIVLQEDFKVGVPDVSVITLESFNSAPLVTGTFTNVTARYDWLIDVGQLGYTWEWIVPSSQVIYNSPTYSYIHVSPLGNPTSIYIKTRACNECGPSEWKGKWFIVETPPAGCTSCPTGPGIIHY